MMNLERFLVPGSTFQVRRFQVRRFQVPGSRFEVREPGTNPEPRTWNHRTWNPELWNQEPAVVTDKGRLVYSTGIGAMCPDCGWPKDNCQCSKQFDQPVPLKIVAKLRMEKKGRGGKTVTVVDGLPRNSAFLKELSQELKRACGTGGAVLDGGVELQGDLRDRVRAVLEKKGYTVKG